MTPTRRDVLATPAVLLAPRPTARSVVWVWLAGGPAAADTFDAANQRFGESFPKLAARADRLTVVRDYGHHVTSHTRATHLTLTGVDHAGIDDGASQVEPSIGSVIAATRGAGSYVRIGRTTGDGPGRLGPAFAPRDIAPTGNIAADLTAARQACAAGAAFVLVHHPGWDMHADAVTGVRRIGPPLDAAVAAFLDACGNEILLVMTGEFGRTRRLNAHGGRDHDPTETPLLVGGAVSPGRIAGPADLLALIRRTTCG